MTESRVKVKVSKVVRILDEQERICYELADDGEGNVKIVKVRNAGSIRLEDLEDAVRQLKGRP